MNERFIPKQGDTVEVSNEEDFKDIGVRIGRRHREFISMTKNDEKYVCYSAQRNNAMFWSYARPIDKHKELEECIALGAKIESYKDDSVSEYGWFDYEGYLEDGREYRIKGGISTDAFKKHYKTIIAYWSGAYVKILEEGMWNILPLRGNVLFLEKHEYIPYLPEDSIIEVWYDDYEAIRIAYFKGFTGDFHVEANAYSKNDTYSATYKNFKVIKYADEN